MTELETPKIDWKELVALFTPNGQQQIVEFVERAKRDRGANWLPEIKAEYPMFAWIVELVATRNADEAFTELQTAYKGLPLIMIKPQVIEMHGWLRDEIEKKR